MKNILLVFAFIGVFISTSSAQFSAGLGLFYGFDVEEVGIQARGIYSINETWRGAADFVFYLDGEDNVSFWELNFNGHYIFYTNEKVLAYGLGGLNIFGVKVDFDGQSNSDSEVGLNIGAGAQYSLSEKVSILGELKYSISDADQLGIGVGVLASF